MVALSRPESSKRNMDGPISAVYYGFSQHVVSFAGRSQYNGGGGASACGLAALNCARVVLGKERDGVKDVDLLQDMMKKETLEVCD